MLKTNMTIKQEILELIDRPIVLIGLMGAGKTKIGKDLAVALDLPFIDSDDEIEKASGYKVTEMFERFGEAYFREGEKRVIKRLITEHKGIISTGGGAVMQEDTARLIWEQALSIWVSTDIQTTLNRVTKNIQKRPMLLNGNPEKILKMLMNQRYPVYEKADIHLQNNDDSSDNTIDLAIEAVHKKLLEQKHNI
jgi:shikimate kinase